MLRIGYVRLGDARSADDTAALKAAGCHVVRAEEPSPGGVEDAVLRSILDFVADGDQLVVARLENLGAAPQAVLSVIDRLERKNASVCVVEPAICSAGEGGRALRAALQAVAGVPGAWTPRKRRGTPSADEILALQEAGVGPVEIARRLGVSRMTVWRKLRTLDA
jgi:DNA invertase Pin-like site-specific DNA recombinase